MKTINIVHHCSAACLVTVLCLVVYAAVQQTYRTAANDPQVQLATEIKNRLEQSESILPIFPSDTISLTRGLSVFAALYNADGQPISSSGFLHGQMPRLPAGVFEVTKTKGENRVTWQPEPGVRMAMVLLKINTATVQFVAVGRSLQEIELRENNLLVMVLAGWIICLTIIGVNAVFYFFLKKQING